MVMTTIRNGTPQYGGTPAHMWDPGIWVGPDLDDEDPVTDDPEDDDEVTDPDAEPDQGGEG